MALNHIVVIGRLCADPGSQYTSSGITLAKFRVAVDRDVKNTETGERETDFFNVVAWRRTAEFVTQYITKGRLVAVSGRMQTRSWIADDGQKRYASEIVAENVQALDRAKDDGEGGGEYAEPAARTPRTASAQPNPDDHDPFSDE